MVASWVSALVAHTMGCLLSVPVIGSVESGKSTLIGVLTRGCLDDGNGLARMQVFRYESIWCLYR